MGYGFGSYTFTDGVMQFRTFLLNVLYCAGLVPNFYFACAQRARVMSVRLTGKEWRADSFDVRHSAVGGALLGPPPTVEPEKMQRG